jgi:23S rRNA-/tRNA-specific pseudouridylate synthase
MPNISDPNYPERIEHTRLLVVTAGQQPERIDRYLTQLMLRATRSKVQEAIIAGNVLVNGQPTRANYKVRPGDSIQITLMKPPPIVLVPQDIPLDIRYEDEHLLVIHKPAGMVTHPGFGNRSGTLVNAVLYHLGERESGGVGEGVIEEIGVVDASGLVDEGGVGTVDSDVRGGAEVESGGAFAIRPERRESDDEVEQEIEMEESEESEPDELEEDGDVADGDAEPIDEEDEEEGILLSALRPGIVHRLDKETSGLMVVAKNAEVQAGLARQFAERTVKREYWAVVWGKVEKDEGEIEGNIARDTRDRKKFAVSRRDGKYALTRYRVVEHYEFATLLALRLSTGRTHQIRVHCAHIRHPLFGDPTYGGRHMVHGSTAARHKQHVVNLLKIITRQALHAKTLGFTHPVTGEWLEFDSELPEDMKELLSKLRVVE